MDISTMKTRESEKGFTLVELAVVMIIIGLLIGGILKGQELITNARVTTTASEMESMSAAFNGFRDQFNALPGDMGNAVARIAGCNNIDACDDGDGSGVNDGDMSAAAGNDEGVFFFGQLLAANLLSGLDGTNDGTAAAFGVTNPTAPVGGGYLAGDSRVGVPADMGVPTFRAGTYILLQNTVAASAADSGPLTTGQAANIDRRLDDGAPTTGIMLSDDGCSTGGAAGDPYNEADLGISCSLAYRL